VFDILEVAKMRRHAYSPALIGCALCQLQANSPMLPFCVLALFLHSIGLVACLWVPHVNHMMDCIYTAGVAVPATMLCRLFAC
jgi:hypothetical protein